MPAPSTATTETWPPDYVEAFAWRQKQALKLKANPATLYGAKEFYRSRPVEFINHWAITYDPRLASGELPAKLPFILFRRQADLVTFLLACLHGEENGLVEKCRDAGATWVCCAFSVWLWLFWPGAAVGWGSRKEQLVDRIGDADSIFEKMRIIVRGLPRQFWPAGFSPVDHMTYMRLINPENDASITGEAGDNIGRGGRKLIYFKDESAHYERPEKIEAALADNTRVQIDISSVNGLGNVFHRRREAGSDWQGGPVTKGKTNVFVFDWRDHPGKDQAWYDARRGKAQADGLMHVFAQEVDRNYAAAVDNVIIPAEWVKAAIDAHVKLGFDDTGMWMAALDVADEGGDRNALSKRKGVILKSLEEWGERDTGETTRRAVDGCAGLGEIDLQYDSVGVGAGVKAEANRLADENLLPPGLFLTPWSAGAAVLWPDQHVEPNDRQTPLNKDFYANLKAQAWWQLRRRFERTWRAINDPGFTWAPEDLISLPSTLPLLRQLEKELSQPTTRRDGRMRLVIDKAPPGTRSPNLADSVVMVYWPVETLRPLRISPAALAAARSRTPLRFGRGR
ncbi:TerL protein [Methylobacterium currus]|uniref:TerL protein n=1 Tax=Methylobacterium currus TaxID=2051553 RepID=A0A2R4WI67_9HYPH|nr:TerL protein [Methylobacterium currus]